MLRLDQADVRILVVRWTVLRRTVVQAGGYESDNIEPVTLMGLVYAERSSPRKGSSHERVAGTACLKSVGRPGHPRLLRAQGRHISRLASN